MEEVKAIDKYVKVSPRKTRLVIDLIRGKGIDQALNILVLSDKAVSKTILKILKSAVANAENNFELDVDSLYVKKAYVDQGPTQKRMRPRAMGRGNVIRKRTSHITLVVAEKNF